MNLKMPSRMCRFYAVAVAAAALVAAPAAAHAQSLNSVAIATDASDHFFVLDVSGGSTAPGAEVVQWPGHGGANQRWNFVALPNGNELIVNQKSNMCLTVSGVAGRSLYQWYCNGDPRQEWRGDLEQIFGGSFRDGKALSNPSTGLRADVEGRSGLAGARVVGWYANGGVNQHFGYWQLF
jgi:ricin-type beta-trefoil lectin protein